MTNHLTSHMSDDEISKISLLGLAHVGDAAFELMVRTWLCTNGRHTSKSLHTTTVRYVCAKAQAQAVQRLLPQLTEAELAIYKRGRNAKVNTVPKNADLADYHAATGFEALFGYLYLKGEADRLNELFATITEEKNAP